MLFALAFIVPDSAELRQPMPKPFIDTPALVLPGSDEPVRVHVNARFHVTLTAAEVVGWQPVGRIREQLLMQISAHCAEYTTRPGIISIPAVAEPVLEQREPDNPA